MENDKLLPLIEASYRNINFISRYKELMLRHNNFESRLLKIDKKEILKILKELGLSFKIFTSGQDFYLEDKVHDFKFTFSFNAKNGIMASYIYVYRNEDKIPFPYPNLGFVYKFLLDNMDLNINALNFRDYQDFKKIMYPLIQIYEDFKGEFLRQVEQEG